MWRDCPRKPRQAINSSKFPNFHSLVHSLRPNFKEKHPPSIGSTIGSFDSTTSSKSSSSQSLESTLKPSKPRHAFAKRINTPRKVRFSQPEVKASIAKSITRAALDSGASANCFPASCMGTNHKDVSNDEATLAQAADDRITASQAADELALETLPKISEQVDKCNEITTPLPSVNKLCKGDLDVLFHGPKATVFKPSAPAAPIAGQTIMEGQLDSNAELHTVNVLNRDTPCKFREGTKPSIKHAKTITFKSVFTLINHHHLCLGAPPIKSWLSAINKGWLTSFPGLAAARVNHYCDEKLLTSKGHLKPQRQHVQPTSPKFRNKKLAISTHEVQDLKNLMGMDGTGRHPITSASGMQHMLVFIDHNSNCIRIAPIKSRKSEHLVEACKATHTWFKERGFEAELLRLDNEISKLMIQAIKEKGQECQLASPSDHRTNPAERAIQHVKAHFISIRSGCDPNFPKEQWDPLIPHAEFTLNLLRPSKLNKNISACTIINGHYDFMRHPISIAGTKVLVHDRPMDRGSWDDQGTEGFSSANQQITVETTNASFQAPTPSGCQMQWNSFQHAVKHQKWNH